ncbi:hypothetical protein, partial [uncultured Lentibacter sp.]|uniref:hypothetical protein n=1 Tax=uncultured Lentibacter sp. TaxID=1659309 RepID=UPI00261D02FF
TSRSKPAPNAAPALKPPRKRRRPTLHAALRHAVHPDRPAAPLIRPRIQRRLRHGPSRRAATKARLTAPASQRPPYGAPA